MAELGDKFRWVAYNNDGGAVSQVAASGQKNSYDDLPLDDLKSFELWDWRRNERVLLVNFKQGERLVWRRRIHAALGGGGVLEVCHVVGKIGKDYKGIMGIFESDGHVEVVADFLPTSEWFYPPASEAEAVS